MQRRISLSVMTLLAVKAVKASKLRKAKAEAEMQHQPCSNCMVNEQGELIEMAEQDCCC